MTLINSFFLYYLLRELLSTGELPLVTKLGIYRDTALELSTVKMKHLKIVTLISSVERNLWSTILEYPLHFSQKDLVLPFNLYVLLYKNMVNMTAEVCEEGS